MAVLHPTCDVRYRVVDGLGVLLDLRAGEYSVLDHVATAMWRVLVGVEPEHRVAALQETLDVPPSRLQEDLTAFSFDCVQRGFLQAEPPVAVASDLQPPPPQRRALTLRAWWSLLSVTRSLKTHGFGPTYVQCLHMTKPAANGSDLEDRLERAERAFERAENLFLIRTAPKDCLPRSLALYRFLLSVGISANHFIGVTRYPFAAHAWVEHQGSVLFDEPDNVRVYAVLART